MNTNKLVDEYKRADSYYSTIREQFIKYEAMLVSKNLDSKSKQTKSQVFDSKLFTIIFERSARVMNQLATGQVLELSKADKGKAELLNLVIRHYIEPNANSGGDLLTKFRMQNLYSHVYGSMAVLCDYVISEAYTGPDMWLVPIRDIVPQPNKTFISDCDYVYVKTRVSKNWLKERGGSWDKKAISHLIEVSKDDSRAYDIERSYLERKEDHNYREEQDNYKQILLVNKYEKGTWTTFAPDYPDVKPLRKIKNPHKNGKLPIVVKDSIPLLDRFIGLGDFERGVSLQYAINSTWNIALDSAIMALYPPTKIKLDEVVPSTIKNEAGARWVINSKGNMDSIQVHNVTSQSLAGFNSVHGALSASLLNMAGTTNTSESANVDPGLGKTPAAINYLNERQNARDSYDRHLQEKVIEQVYDLFIDILLSKQETPIDVTMFAEEIEGLIDKYPECAEMLEEDGESIYIKPDSLKSGKYRFTVDAGSTYRKNELAEKQELTGLVQLIATLPGAQERIAQQGVVKIGDKEVDFGQLIYRLVAISGISEPDEIIREAQIEGVDQMGMQQGAQQGMPPEGMPPQGVATQGQVNFEDPQIAQVWNSLRGQ
jgi:hypothetical protein